MCIFSTFICVSGGKTTSFFGKFGVLYFIMQQVSALISALRYVSNKRKTPNLRVPLSAVKSEILIKLWELILIKLRRQTAKLLENLGLCLDFSGLTQY